MASFLRHRISLFWYYLCYFLFLSVLGLALLRFIPARQRPANLDLFFMVVSALTATGLNTAPLESFSNGQLLVLTFLIVVGGEVFTSTLELCLRMIKAKRKQIRTSPAEAPPEESAPGKVELELGGVVVGAASGDCNGIPIPGAIPPAFIYQDGRDPELESAAMYLALVASGYFVCLLLLGFLAVLVYLLLFDSAADVLRSKHIRLPTFSIFVSASTFMNCGLIPNNEGISAFQNNSGLLLLLSPLVLAGNTLFPPFLRLLLRIIRKLLPAARAGVLDRLLKDGFGKAIKYPHLLSASRCLWLATTVGVFLVAQTVLLCAMEWRPSGALGGIRGSYRKVVGAWYQSVNTRHCGENIVDLSSVAAAVQVLCVVMMNLPTWTCIGPCRGKNISTIKTERSVECRARKLWEKFRLSHIYYLAGFIFLICITERKRMSNDSRNFSVFNIIFEVVSAYGNVGFSTGYSCQRQLTPDPSCVSPSYSLVGTWSTTGKLLIIVLMLFGRLKRFTMTGGKAWKLE